jgi:hypothetical protein
MPSLTAQVHVTGSTQKLDEDLPFLQAIVEAVRINHADVSHDWLDETASRKARPDENDDWKTILNNNLESIKKSDLVIIEATQGRFSQGLQAYTAAQYKRPTLIVTRSAIKNHFISGVGNKLITVKQYESKEELKSVVAEFIKQNSIPEKDLRFNMILDRRIYKYLRDTSYETGKNKSQIIRGLLEKDIKKRQ